MSKTFAQDLATSRRRFLAVLGVSLAVPGGWAIAGALLSRTKPASVPEGDNSVVEQARRTKAMRDDLLKLGRERRWQDLIAKATEHLATKENASLYEMRAEAYFRLGDRKKAAEDFAKARPDDAIQRANLRLLRGDITGYQAACQEMMAETEKPEAHRYELNRVAWLCTLSPQSGTDPQKVIQCCEKALAMLKEAFLEMPAITLQSERGRARPIQERIAMMTEERGNYLNTLGAALYRAGRYADAVARLQESESVGFLPENWAYLAMCHHRLKHKEEAKMWTEKMRTFMEKSYGRMNFIQSRLEMLRLTEEMEATLQSEP